MSHRITNGNETWRFQYNPETKQQSMQWKTQNSPRLKKARMSRSQVKTTLVCFFYHKWIVHYEFIVQGQRVNQERYLEVLTRLWESVQTKRPGLWPHKWILHHDNAPAHDVLRVSEFVAKNSLQKWTIHLIHLTWPPVIFGSFQKLKNALKGRRFDDLSDIQCYEKTLLLGILENDF
jgi:hypothetical protein